MYSDTFYDRLGERMHERNVLVNAARICGIDDPNTQEAEVEELEVEEESANAMNVHGSRISTPRQPAWVLSDQGNNGLRFVQKWASVRRKVDSIQTKKLSP